MNPDQGCDTPIRYINWCGTNLRSPGMYVVGDRAERSGQFLEILFSFLRYPLDFCQRRIIVSDLVLVPFKLLTHTGYKINFFF